MRKTSKPKIKEGRGPEILHKPLKTKSRHQAFDQVDRGLEVDKPISIDSKLRVPNKYW
jgi:hypothetical protein